MDAALLPLFPLEVVLFPGMSLPLHIFEPRYKLMIRRCLDQREEFGVTLARSEGIARVGCTAEILKVVKQYDDGRMDILTVGRRRFELLEAFEDQPYLQGRVEYWVGEQELSSAPEASARLRQSYEKVCRLLTGRLPAGGEFASDSSLSFQIAAELPLDLDSKQQLLEMRSEAERQERLAERLAAWATDLERLKRAKQKAAGNGHGR